MKKYYNFTGTSKNIVPIFYKNVSDIFFSVFYYCFSIDNVEETEEKHGLAHLVEHVIAQILEIDNKEELLPLKNLDDVITSITSTNYVLHGGNFLYDNSDIIIRMICKTLFDPDLISKYSRYIKESLEYHKNIVIKEILLYQRKGEYESEKKIYSLLQMENEFYRKHRRGTPETVKNITYEDVIEFIQKVYVPENLTLFGLGPRVFEKMDKNLKKLPVPKVPSKKISKKTELPKLKKKAHVSQVIDDNRANGQARITLFSYFDANNAKTRAMNAILMKMIYNYLYEELREKNGYIYDLVINNEYYSDLSVSRVEIYLDPEKISEVVQITDNLQIAIFDKEKFTSAKNQKTIDLYKAEVLCEDEVRQTIQQLLVFGEIIDSGEILNTINHVTFDQFTDFLESTLSEESKFTWIIMP